MVLKIGTLLGRLGITIALLLLPLVAKAQDSPLEAVEDFDYWQDLCQLQIRAETYDQALEACEQAIALEPKNADVWTLHSGLLVALERYPEAIASANRALNFNEDYSLAIAYQCLAYLALEQPETALDHCNTALKVNGHWGDKNPAIAWFHRGLILAQDQDYDQALVAYERAALLELDADQTSHCQSSLMTTDEEVADAMKACALVLAENDDWTTTSRALMWTYLGQAQTHVGQYDAAIDSYDQSLTLDPENGDTWTAQGNTLVQIAVDYQPMILTWPQVLRCMDQQRHPRFQQDESCSPQEIVNRFNQEALVSYTQAIAIQADDSEALLGQCTVQNRLKQYEPALAACDAALDADRSWGDNRTVANVWHERSIALTGMGQYDEALASINRAVGSDPQDVAARNHHSVVFWSMKDYDRAIMVNETALILDQAYAHGWLTRGLILRAQGAYGEALAVYDRGLQLDSLNAWTWTNRSMVLWEVEDYEEAIASATHALTLSPLSVQAWYNRGAAQSAMGDYGGAIASYDNVLVLDDQYADALIGRGVARFHLGDEEGAMADLEMAIALKPDDALAQDTLSLLTPEASE